MCFFSFFNIHFNRRGDAYKRSRRNKEGGLMGGRGIIERKNMLDTSHIDIITATAATTIKAVR